MNINMLYAIKSGVSCCKNISFEMLGGAISEDERDYIEDLYERFDGIESSIKDVLSGGQKP